MTTLRDISRANMALVFQYRKDGSHELAAYYWMVAKDWAADMRALEH